MHKGSFGEMMGDQSMLNEGNMPLLGTTQLGDVTNTPGLDGLWRDAGPPPRLLVTEAKYRSGDPFDVSDFPSTGSGPQMDTTWIEGHADTMLDNGRIDDATHRQLMRNEFTPVLQRVGPDGNVQNIDLSTGRDMDTGEQVFMPQEIENWRDN